MRTRTFWLAWLLTAGMALAPATARAQELPRPDFELPVPLGHDRMDKGGLFVAAEFAMFRQTNPLRHQDLAFRGFVDFNGGVTGVPGAFVGDHSVALDARDAGGPGTYQPGFKVGIGWRFHDGSVLEVNYMWLQKAVYNATATGPGTPGSRFGANLENTFLWSPVSNFPSAYSGPIVDSFGNDADVGNSKLPGAGFGIWNAADIMSIDFQQRTQQLEATWRKPIFDTEYWRCYGLIGPRFFWIWERFKWRTVDEDLQGNASPLDVAVYTNIVSNRMYGAHMGVGNEWYLGHGFAVSLDLQGAVFIDIIKERAKYELGEKDAPPQNKRSITDYTGVPEIEGSLNLWWYPHEAIQLRVGYDAMVFFNTKASRTPVDFNWGAVAPPYEHVIRVFDGLNAGIALIF